MATRDPASKPLLFGTTKSDTETFHESNAYAWEHMSPGWVPGYDEHIKANAIAANPHLSRARKEQMLADLGAAPKQLSARVAWVRTRGVDGSRSYNASIDQSAWRRKGYRPASLDDLTAAGFSIPDTAHLEADGSVRREDCDLWIVDESRARAFDKAQAEFNADFHAFRPAETRDSDVPYIDVLEEHRESITDLSTLQD